MFKRHFVSFAELKQRVPKIAINKLGHRHSGVDKPTPPQRRVAEIAFMRLDSVEITVIGRGTGERTAIDPTPRKNRLKNERVPERRSVDNREIGKDTLEGRPIEIAIFQSCAGETNPPQVPSGKIQIGKMKTVTVYPFDNRGVSGVR